LRRAFLFSVIPAETAIQNYIAGAKNTRRASPFSPVAQTFLSAINDKHECLSHRIKLTARNLAGEK
jgi:hypothetical protein